MKARPKKEAIRSLKRRLSDVISRQLTAAHTARGGIQGRLGNQRGRYSTLIKRPLRFSHPGPTPTLRSIIYLGSVEVAQRAQNTLTSKQASISGAI